jgi:protein arginine N-methyltransferase 5
MSYSDSMEPSAPLFYIGHHETKRGLNVSSELVQHAQDLGVSTLWYTME